MQLFVKNMKKKLILFANLYYIIFWQLKKELDCKMECKEFYKKYYKLTIETKEKQAELCKKNKKEDDRKSIEFEIE